MRSTKRVLVCMVLLTLFIVSCKSYNIQEQEISIGVSDDTSGFVVDYLIEERGSKLGFKLKPFIIKDC